MIASVAVIHECRMIDAGMLSGFTDSSFNLQFFLNSTIGRKPHLSFWWQDSFFSAKLFPSQTLGNVIVMDLKPSIVRFLKEKYAAEVAENESLFERGCLDSMALLELLGFIEERMGVRVPDSEVLPENFETIANIDALVKRLQS